MDDPTSAAKILRELFPCNYMSIFVNSIVAVTQHQLGMPTGAVFAVPIPPEYESVGLELQKAVECALAEAKTKGVDKWGKAATPWLLKRVGELTAGKSLESSECAI